jgi:hypothetical protein
MLATVISMDCKKMYGKRKKFTQCPEKTQWPRTWDVSLLFVIVL